MEPSIRHQKLLGLATQYNAEHPKSAIDLVKYQTPDELLFSLWARKVDVGVLGFGYPYDYAIKEWPPSDYEDDEPICDLNKLTSYRIYQHRNQLGDFLLYELYSPLIDNRFFSDKEKSRVKETLKMFNCFYTLLPVSNGQPIESYSQIQQMLENKQFSDLDLFYLMIQCENRRIFDDNNSYATYHVFEDKLSRERFLERVE